MTYIIITNKFLYLEVFCSIHSRIIYWSWQTKMAKKINYLQVWWCENVFVWSLSRQLIVSLVGVHYIPIPKNKNCHQIICVTSISMHTWLNTIKEEDGKRRKIKRCTIIKPKRMIKRIYSWLLAVDAFVCGLVSC